jgi:DNA (cytosine-5)-methyltransferase 1
MSDSFTLENIDEVLDSISRDIHSELGTTRPLRVGTDCSGIEAPIQALKNLGINFEHVFSCEIDKYARQSIRANYEPGILYEDITTRDHSALPDIDLYVCGFPCQPFSHAGTRRGVDDPRGTIFWHCLETIKEKLPFVFILENVRGLLSINNGETFKEIIKSLKEIGMYKVEWKLMNTKDYGIPQNRSRVYIVGIRDDYNIQFTWPIEKYMKPLSKYVDIFDDKKEPMMPSAVQMLDNIPINSLFIDTNFRKYTYPNSDKICPTIMSRCYTWCVPMSRYANIKELLSLQGFPKDFIQVVSKTQMKRQIGNSMSVNVLNDIFRNILKRSDIKGYTKRFNNHNNPARSYTYYTCNICHEQGHGFFTSLEQLNYGKECNTCNNGYNCNRNCTLTGLKCTQCEHQWKIC